MVIYKITMKAEYIPRNIYRKWAKKGDIFYLHGKNKKELLKYFEPEARTLVRKKKIIIKKVL